MLSKVKFDVITRGKDIWKHGESDGSGTKLCQKYYGERKKLNIINGIYSWMGKMYISFVCQIIIMLQSFKDYTKTFWLAWFFSKWGGIKKIVLSTDHLAVWNQLATSSATPLFDDLLFISTFRQFTWPPMIFFLVQDHQRIGMQLNELLLKFLMSYRIRNLKTNWPSLQMSISRILQIH